MGLMRRVITLFQARARRALDRVEDPRDTFDASYERQLELLTQVRRGVADVATTRKRLEMQAEQIRASRSKLDDQARQVLTAGREDLARFALSRKAELGDQLSRVQAEAEELATRQSNLTESARQLATRIGEFRSRKETMKARYTAAEAQVRIGEAYSGASQEMADLGFALQRAEDKTEQMQARAAALEELTQDGGLSAVGADPLDVQLDRIQRGRQVEAQLGQLRRELGQPGDVPVIESANPQHGRALDPAPDPRHDA